ncbi:MAG: hypothetical protein ABR912_09395 [Terracidiphilus sp.]|jgi:hypothetical protein
MSDLLQPWHILVLFFVFGVFFLVPAIFYLLTLQNVLNKCAPTSRAMEPGMVWLLLVPLFNLVWNFFVVMSIAKSVSNEYARRGQPSPEPAPGQPLGLAMSICACCCIIPFLSIFAGLANLVLWIVYWVKIAEYSRNLDLPQIAVPVPPSI